MIEIDTRHGKHIYLISERELRDPLRRTEYVRAYCHIHGSDHQRSLSISRRTGWGQCFNANCEALVLVMEWNPEVAERLLYFQDHGGYPSSSLFEQPMTERHPELVQPVLLLPMLPPPVWQQEEREALLALERPMREALARSQRAGDYLRGRKIPLSIAQAAGVCYLPPGLLGLREARPYRSLLRRWTERLLFPLQTPDGKGFIGRSLWRWVPGMNEHIHKGLLDRPGEPRRWIKTNPAGWFGPDADYLSKKIILVEGAFDRLALLAAGMRPSTVVALGGTAIRADWLPGHVCSAVLALDADSGGEHAANRLREQLEEAGIDVEICSPPDDGWGKDWSERWCKRGHIAMRLLFEARRGFVSCIGA